MFEAQWMIFEISNTQHGIINYQVKNAGEPTVISGGNIMLINRRRPRRINMDFDDRLNSENLS